MHPDVTAPGVDISSTCDTTGTVVGPCPPGENTTASGTSMASPHIAGAAAVLKQAQPALTPTQVRQALEATATHGQGRRRHGDRAVLAGRPRLREPRQGGHPGPPQRLAHGARLRGEGGRRPGAGLRRAEGAARRLLDLRRTAGDRRRLGHEDLHGTRGRLDREAVRQRRAPVGRDRSAPT